MTTIYKQSKRTHPEKHAERYIITEELLEPIEDTTCPISKYERQRLSEYARSHPYNPQAEDIDEWCKLHEEILKDIRTEAYRSGYHDGEKVEREKVLDELIEWRDKQKTGKCSEMSDWFDIWCDEGEFIQKLRQEDKQEEKE